MTAVFPPIQNKNSVDVKYTTDDASLKQKVNSVQAATTNVSTQLAQITKWSDGIKRVLKTLADTQAEIKSSASSVKTDGTSFKDALTEIKEDVVTALNSFDGKINEINSVIETVKNVSNSNQAESFDIVLDTLDSISEQIVAVDTKFTPVQASLERVLLDSEERVYILLQNISKQIQDYTEAIPSSDEIVDVLKPLLLILTQRIDSIENYIYNSGCWYGKNEATNDLDSESMVGWSMAVSSEPTLITNGNVVKDEFYAIRNIFISSANMANKMYKIRFYTGKSDAFKDATILSEVLYVKVGNLLNSIPITVSSPLISRGNKLWCTINCEAPAAILSLLISI